MWGIFLEDQRTGERELFENLILDDEDLVRTVHANLCRSAHPFLKPILHKFDPPQAQNSGVITEDLPHIVVT
jgi:hypothetical protein